MFELQTWKVGARMKAKSLPDYIVEGVLIEKSQALLYSHTGHGKTFMAEDIACHVTTGLPYHGRAVKQKVVYYVAAEGVDEIEQRMASWSHYHGVTLDALHLIDIPLQLHDDEQMDALRRDMIATGAGLVIFDTAEKVTIGTDENAPTQVNLRVNEPLEQIKRETGATTLLIHHQGSGKLPRWRGCTAWGTPNDTILRVETRFRVAANRDTPLAMTLQIEKQRGEPPFALAFQPIVVPKVGSMGSGKTTLVLEPISLEQVEVLAPKRGSTKTSTTNKTVASAKKPTPKQTHADRIVALLSDGIRRSASEIAAALGNLSADTARTTMNRDGRFVVGSDKLWEAI